MGFSSSLKANINRALYRVNLKCYDIAKELFESIVNKTPSPTNPGRYAHGHLANQWYPEVGGDFSEELDSRVSGIGADSLARIKMLKGGEFNQRDGKLTLTNNLSYAYQAEAIGWHPPKWSGKSGSDNHGGPYRMVALSLQSIAAKYQ